MNFAGLLDSFLNSSAADTAQDRLRNALGGEGSESGGSLLGGLGQAVGSLLGGGSSEGSGGGLLGGLAGGLLGGGGAGGGLGQALGSLFGGGSSPDSGAEQQGGGGLSGALLPLLAGLAMNAVRGFAGQGSGQAAQALPIGLRQPQDAEEEQALQQNAQIIIKAMINAAKADGQVDQQEMQAILGRLQESGADAEAREFIREQMDSPFDLQGIVDQVEGQELAAQVYAATLLAIKVDTEAEQTYVEELAEALDLPSEVTQRIRQGLGVA